MGSNVACGLAFTGSQLKDKYELVLTNSLYSLHDLPGFLPFADYHVVADGYGGKGYLIGRKQEDQLRDIIRQAQEETREGKAVLLNVLIGKTNFREGSISV